MAKKTIKAQMKQRRDTQANWASTNPVLLDGELGIVSDDPNLYKVGDGTTAWNSLPFRGFDGTLAQELGTSPNAVISQKVVSEKLTELEGYYESVFALAAGGYHSSTKDRIEINRAIKAGEKYILRGELLGASVVNYSLSVVYADSTDYVTVGTYKFGTDVVLTAPKDIISIGFYIEGISVSGNVSMQVTTNRYSVLSNLRYELLPAEEGHTLIPNINTADGTMTMQGILMIDGIPYYVNDKTFNIKGGVISSAVVIVYNRISQEFYSKAYDNRVSLDEIIIGTARVNYSATGEYKYLVRASFPFDYTIDGKHLRKEEINEVKSLIVEINPPSTFKGSFALTAGGYHSSTKDRIEINGAIKAGDNYILRGNLEEGAVVTKNIFQVQVVYADSADYINIGDFPYYQDILLTAPKDMVSIGFYVEGISVGGKSAMTITRVSGNIQNAEVSSSIPVDYSWEKYMDISGVQGSCVHDDILFAFNAASNGSLEANVYNLSQKSFIQTLTFAGMAVANTHANSVGFGRKYAESDEFPLLYISSGYPISGTADTQVYCYRIQGSLGSLAATLIQTITLRGFGTWTEGVVDRDHERLWVKYHSNDYECHNLPAVSDGDVVINQGAEVIDSISLDGVHFPPYIAGSSPQGHYYHKGKLIYVSGIPYMEGAESCFLSVINLRGHCRESVIWLEDVGLTNGGINNLYEPEGVFFWQGKLYISFQTFVAKIEGYYESAFNDNFAIGGYKVVNSIAELPDVGEENVGYLIGTHLYVYVGTEGDIKNGAYQDCGEFKGPQGEKGEQGPQGEKGDTGPQGEQGPQGPQGNSGYAGAANELQVVNDLTSGGATAALSAEQGKILNRQLYGMGIYVTTFSVTAGVGHSSTIDRVPCFIKNGEPFYVYARLRNGAYITNISVTPSSSANWQGIGNHKAYNPPSKWTAPFDVTEIGYYIDPASITSSGDVDVIVIANPLAALL